MRKNEDLLSFIGDRIRESRRHMGISQEEFADRVDLDRSYIGSVERGERNISAINLTRIAETLGVEVGDLFPSAKIIKSKQRSSGKGS